MRIFAAILPIAGLQPLVINDMTRMKMTEKELRHRMDQLAADAVGGAAGRGSTPVPSPLAVRVARMGP